MTGAGRAQRGVLVKPLDANPPACGGEDAMRPEDSAIIEVSIGKDGQVLYAVPVWAERPNTTPISHERRATGDGKPEASKAFPISFRYRVRMEIRCSTAFERPSIAGTAQDALVDWAEAEGVSIDETGDSALATLAADKAKLTALPASGASIAALEFLRPLSMNGAAPRDEKLQWAVRARAIADTQSPLARLALDLTVWRNEGADRYDSDAYRTRLIEALGQPPYASDPRARSVLALLIADWDRRSGKRG